MASGMRSVGTKKLKLKFVKNLPVFWDVIIKNTMLRRRLNYTFVSHILLRLPHNLAPCHVFCCPGLDQSTQRDRSQTVEDHFKVKHRLKHNCEDNGSFFFQSLLDRMIKEENGLKKRLVESLEHSIKQCVRLSKVCLSCNL